MEEENKVARNKWAKTTNDWELWSDSEDILSVEKLNYKYLEQLEDLEEFKKAVDYNNVRNINFSPSA